MEKKPSILLTFDVEDWFQVENFKEYIEFSTWNRFELRVEKNTRLILDLLDSFSFKPKATFFILGWIAKKLPGLVREIQNQGHEIASHGNDHHLCTALGEEELLQDLKDSKKQLEDITGKKIYGYRAPSFAVTDQSLKLIDKAGYTYDSSYNSFSAHGRYGKIDLSQVSGQNGVYRLSQNFYELPLSNLTLGQKTIPLGGGGYFRLYPFPLFKQGMKLIFQRENSFTFYAHPWEFDPDQPRVNQASPAFKFRHYINLDKTETKLKKLIQTFSTADFKTCKDQIASQF